MQGLQTKLAALQNLQSQPPEPTRESAGTTFDPSSSVKRTKKTEQPTQLTLETQTIKELTKSEFELVNGGGARWEAIKTHTCVVN